MIPLSVPHLAGNEWKYVKDCLDTGWISSAGAYVNKFEQEVAKYSGLSHGIACMNGTAGLHIGLEICGVHQGDLVLAPNLTFVATLNSISYTGAEAVLVDVDPETWQLDYDLLEAYLTEHTEVVQSSHESFTIHKKTGKVIRAIVPVHVLGVIGDMDKLANLTQEFPMKVVEDCTEALGSTFKGQPAGGFGTFGVFSFNGNKIISTGGGGVMVTNQNTLASKAKHLSTTAKISPDEYIHDEVGYNYRLVNVLAAIGVAQMEQLNEILIWKQEINDFYRTQLEGVGDIQFQKIPDHVKANNWLFTFKTEKMKDLLLYLNEHKIMSRPFWKPMNQLDMFAHCEYISEGNMAQKVYESCISIPSSANLTNEELKQVVQTIKTFYEN